MKASKVITVASVAAALTFSTPLWAQNQSDDPADSNPRQYRQNSSNSQFDNQSSSNRNQQAPEGFVMLDESIVYMLANEPAVHFAQAREDLAANNPRKAAAEIRLAAACLNMQAARPGLQSSSELKDQAKQLHQIARRVEQGELKNASELRQDFCNAELALAQAFQSCAHRDLQQNRTVRAGHDLLAASDALHQAVILSNGQLQSQTSRAISDANDLGNQLINPSNGNNAQQASSSQQPSQQQMNQQDQAMQSSARIRPGDLQSSGTVPSNANQTVNDLGNAIQQVRSSSSQSGSSGQSGNTDQQNSNNSSDR